MLGWAKVSKSCLLYLQSAWIIAQPGIKSSSRSLLLICAESPKKNYVYFRSRITQSPVENIVSSVKYQVDNLSYISSSSQTNCWKGTNGEFPVMELLGPLWFKALGRVWSDALYKKFLISWKITGRVPCPGLGGAYGVPRQVGALGQVEGGTSPRQEPLPSRATTGG